MLTVLGVEARTARYTLNGKETEAELAPVALIDLLPEEEQPVCVLALCTPQAREKTWPKLEQLLPVWCSTKLVEVPAGDQQDDIGKFLEAVAQEVPRDVDLTVDVTHGFRHFSFLTYASVLYLAALRGVRVRGAYYGMLNRGAPSPFLNLRPLLELPRWVHALEVLGETGSALPMAGLLRDGMQGQLAGKIDGELSDLSRAYLSGLPLELGLATRDIRNSRLGQLKKMLRVDHHLPLANELVDQLADILAQQAITDQFQGQQGWKRKVSLSRGELMRQAHIVDDLLERGHTATALGLMNEWTVSWVIWRRSPVAEWLDYNGMRKQGANLLSAMVAVRKAPELRHTLTEEQCYLARFWDELTELRNGYAHHGMRPLALVNDKKTEGQIKRIRAYWDSALSRLPNFSLSLGDLPGGRVLISPVGMRSGVLFSAVKACQASGEGEGPAMCLVICSGETEGDITEALEHAGYSGKVEPLVLEDAFSGGRDEIKRIVKAARRHLIGAAEVVVNVTGGTTLMGLAAEAIASEARKFARPTRRFGLIDRRPTERQDADPYQAGEPFWLDAAEDADGNSD